MTDYYRISIEEGLREYATLIGNSYQLYKALAWQGLKQHDVKAYTDLSDSKKEELKNSLEFHLPTTTPNCPNN
ncbi:hypothetical protein [Lutibacter sp.]